jgi:hypothetical protein
VPTFWRQLLSSADREHPNQEQKRLAFHAKARWLENWDWFGDKSLSDILFEIDLLPDTLSSRTGEPTDEWKGTIGGLRYNDERRDCA